MAKVRVGVALDSTEVPAWQFAILESIATSDFADLGLILLHQEIPATHKARSSSTRWQGIVHRVFLRIEDRARRPEPDACAAVSIDSLAQHVDRITCQKTGEYENNDAWLLSVRMRKLDVLLILGDPAMLPGGTSLARWGHWQYTSHGLPFTPVDGSMVGFGAMLGRRPCFSTSILVHQPGDPVVRTAYRTRSAIDYYSHYVTRNEHLWKCSRLAIRALRKCHEAGGTEFLRSLPATPFPLPRTSLSASAVVSGAVMLSELLAYLVWRIWRKLRRRLLDDRWVLMIGIDQRSPNSGPFRALLPPAGRFWADPHVITADGRHHVYFEDASRDTGIGHIALLSDDGTGSFPPPKAILRKPYHLSYPFVFQWCGDWYLVPESAANRTVELYRCIRFPDEWAFQHNLLEGVEAYDSTLVEHGGRWWLFANVREHPAVSSWDELHVFHSDSPISTVWKAHSGNPVLSDVTCARPAGRFFVQDGRLFRPSQNSARRYGHSLQLNEVIELSEERYLERAVEAIEPTWSRSVRGVHSYSRAGRVTAVDAIRCTPRFSFRSGRP